MPVRAIIGLGNPGVRYERTRHNLGFRISDTLLQVEGGRWERQTPQLRWASCRQGRLIVAQPLTMMNRSGIAVAELVRHFELAPDELLVICDDLDLPLGRFRIRDSGGDGGHRGLASVIQRLGSQDLGRLRVGIDRPPPHMDAAAYVLAPFSRGEEPVVEQVVAAAVTALQLLEDAGYETAMNQYNGWQADLKG